MPAVKPWLLKIRQAVSQTQRFVIYFPLEYVGRPDNNRAERAIRRTVVTRKRPGGNWPSMEPRR